MGCKYIGQIQRQTRIMLSTTTSSVMDGSSPESKKKQKGKDDEKKEKKDDSNWFFDNIGKIFLLAIASLIGTLVRGSYNTSNRNQLRDAIEDASILDPVEVDDLRVANSEFTPDVFRRIVRDVTEKTNGTAGCTMSYHDFVLEVRRVMSEMKGEEFTVQLGHLLDRVAAAVLHEYGATENDPQPLALWFTLLSLAMNSPASERITVLYEMLQAQSDVKDTIEVNEQGEGGSKKVTFEQVLSLVGYLQSTCQLVPDSQVLATDEKYPTQQFKRGTPVELVPWEGPVTEEVDCIAVASILRSKSVCAWGECYHKKKFD